MFSKCSADQLGPPTLNSTPTKITSANRRDSALDSTYDGEDGSFLAFRAVQIRVWRESKSFHVLVGTNNFSLDFYSDDDIFDTIDFLFACFVHKSD
jgi:hypothetical protein